MERRNFLKTMGAAAAFTIVPRHVLGNGFMAPSDTVNLAAIGVGSQGGGDIQNIMTPEVPIDRTKQTRRRSNLSNGNYSGAIQRQMQRRASDNIVQMGDAGRREFHYANIYALCDVDWAYAGHIMAGYPSAKKYYDWREMLEKDRNNIDAVLIGTPDHNHAVIASHFMKAGKAVFVEKPMAKTIEECRYLAKLAKETGVVTQMGNQGHNVEGTYQTIEWIQSGLIGDVTEVHMWSNRPMWPQGYLTRGAEQPIPEDFNYDVWLGPAPMKPFNLDFTHFNWRGLWDYGTGAMEENLKSKKHRNVFFHGPFFRSQQEEVLGSAHASIVTLSEGMFGLGVPSKAYNIMAAGRPIIYFGPKKGEIGLLIQEYDIGYIGWPEKWDVDDLRAKGFRARILAEQKYSKDAILKKFITALR